MISTLRLSGLSRVVPPEPTLFCGGVFGLSSSCRRRLSCRHVAGCVRNSPQRDASQQWRVQPTHKPTAPVSLKARVRHAFLSTRQSQRMNQLMSQHVMHAELLFETEALVNVDHGVVGDISACINSILL